MQNEIYRPENPRLKLFYWLYGGMFLFLALGLGYRQIVQHQEFKDREEKQNLRRILIPGPRGNIYDRHGQLLVGNRPVFTAVVYLNELRPEFRREYFRLVREARDQGLNPERSTLATQARSNVVHGYLQQVKRVSQRQGDVDTRLIERHFRQNLLLPLPLIRDLSEEEYARLIEQIPVDSPIQILTDSTRYYPFREAACHFLGFVSQSEVVPDDTVPGDSLRTFRFDGKIGRSGVEKAFNEVLQGNSGGEIWVVDPSGFQYERTLFVPPVKGQDFTCSLDIQVQIAAEQAMDGKTGAAVALDIQTGEVIALASSPAYDLNDLSPVLTFATDRRIRESGGWLNRAIQGLYPPGSTFKLLTSVVALQANIVTPEDEINCPGFHVVGRRRFPCHNRFGHGPQNLPRAIANSCNVYYYVNGVEAGIEALAATARRFGLDQRTGIELPAESGRTVVPDPAYKMARFMERWYDGDTANTSIGQGFLLVTPLQMAAFTASLVRGEYRTRPTIRKLDPGDLPVDHGGGLITIPQSSLDAIYDGMRLAATEGTARLAAIEEAEVAGKTGTAQVPIDGRPSTLAWFTGFAPFDNPRLVVTVMIEGTDPNDTFHGGSTAAPIAKEIFRAYFQSLAEHQPAAISPPLP